MDTLPNPENVTLAMLVDKDEKIIEMAMTKIKLERS
jgi:hypothetical protein